MSSYVPPKLKPVLYNVSPTPTPSPSSSQTHADPPNQNAEAPNRVGGSSNQGNQQQGATTQPVRQQLPYTRDEFHASASDEGGDCPVADTWQAVEAALVEYEIREVEAGVPPRAIGDEIRLHGGRQRALSRQKERRIAGMLKEIAEINELGRRMSGLRVVKEEENSDGEQENSAGVKVEHEAVGGFGAFQALDKEAQLEIEQQALDEVVAIFGEADEERLSVLLQKAHEESRFEPKLEKLILIRRYLKRAQISDEAV